MEVPDFVFDALDFAVDGFDEVEVVAVVVLLPVVVFLGALVGGVEELDPEVRPAEDLDAADLEEVDFVDADLDCFAVEVPAFDVPDFAAVV